MKKLRLLLSLSIVALTSLSQGQTKNSDPFEVKKNAPEAPKSDKSLPKVISLCFETFSLPLADSAALQREGLSDNLLYQRLVENTKEGTVEQESFVVLRCRDGEVATSESIIEKIYPVEWEPPGADSKSVSAIACSFETRNTGLTLDVEATMGTNSEILDIRIAYEDPILTALEEWGQDESIVVMPQFETRRINTSIIATAGKTSLIGTFNRTAQSTIDADAAKKVWLTFITPTIVTIRP